MTGVSYLPQLCAADSRDGVVIVLHTIADMIVAPEDQDGCVRMLRSNSIKDGLPGGGLESRWHVPDQHAAVSDTSTDNPWRQRTSNQAHRVSRP